MIFKLILIQPRNSLIIQYTELLKTEGVLLEFTENAIEEIAEIAYTVLVKQKISVHVGFIR